MVLKANGVRLASFGTDEIDLPARGSIDFAHSRYPTRV
jgi:hypothetical protein